MKIQDKLRNDIEQLQLNYKTDVRERKQIEEILVRDLNAAKDQIRERRIEFFDFSFIVLE
jgi:hypothetical protein